MILIKGRTYAVLKFLAMVAFPAFGTLYFTLAGIWNLPAAEQVVGTVVAVDAFIGVLLQLSSTAYNKNEVGKGTFKVVDNEHKPGKTFSLELDDDPEEMVNKDQLVFKVNKTD